MTDAVSLATQRGVDGLLLTDSPESGRVPLHQLRANPGSASIETLEEELGKLQRLRALALPSHLFDRLAPKIVHGYRRRAAVEEIHGCDAIVRRCVLLCWLHSAVCG